MGMFCYKLNTMVKRVNNTRFRYTLTLIIVIWNSKIEFYNVHNFNRLKPILIHLKKEMIALKFLHYPDLATIALLVKLIYWRIIKFFINDDNSKFCISHKLLIFKVKHLVVFTWQLILCHTFTLPFLIKP